MTLVLIDLKRPGVGGDVPAEGRVEFKPTKRRTVDGAIVMPEAFAVTLDAAGHAEAVVAPTSSEWCWLVQEYVRGGQRRYLQVPDVAQVAYEDLVEVDPGTFDPTPANQAWWKSELDAETADREAADTAVAAGAANALNGHAAAADPHTGYLTKTSAAATYTPRPRLDTWPVYLYGNSYSILAAGWFTAGKHYAQLAAGELGGGVVTSYGVSGRRIIDVVSSLLNGTAFPGCSGVIAAGKWPGVSARSGLVILESFINDMGHYPNMTGAAIPAAVTTAYRNAMKVAYRAALALISSESRVEAASATVTGAWTRGSTQGYASAGLVDFTTANGATATYSLTPPQSGPLAGKVYLVGFIVDPSLGTMAAQEVRVDNILQTSRTPAPWEQYVGNTGGQVNIGPDVIEVTLPIDGAAHNVELKHVGSAGHLLYNDAAIVPSANPNPIAVMGAEHPIPGTPTWTAAQTGVYTANNRLMAPDLKAVVAEFPHAFYVPSTMTANGLYSVDGLHPNDRGMAQRGHDLVRAIEGSIAARLQNRVESARPNSDFAIV